MIKEPTLREGREIQEGHLGGCWTAGDPATWNPNLWDYFMNTLGVKSVIDIGCGTGLSMNYFLSKGCEVLGLEGAQGAIDASIIKEKIVLHDFANGPYIPQKNYDLAWTAEFIEHVEERFIPNFVEVFQKCKYIALTYATPGQGGYHHVNEQHPEYWIEKIQSFGLKYEQDMTAFMRKIAVKDEEKAQSEYPGDVHMISHFARKGLIFTNPNVK